MGCRRKRTQDRHEVTSPHSRASACSSIFFKRRSVPAGIRSGVFFFLAAATVACTTPEYPDGEQPQDTLVIGSPESTASGSDSSASQVARFLTLDSLTQLSVDGRALPRLADKWTWEDNGLRLRVRLHEGVQFHDGTPLRSTLAAEILNEAIRRPANRALYPSFNYVTSVRPEGDNELVVDVSEPSAFLPEDLEVLLEIRSPSRGTGAFRLVTDSPSELVLEGFDEYRGGPPRVRRIVIKPFETLRTAWTSLLRGDLDMVTDVPADALEFMSNEEVQLFSFARRYQFLIAFNSRRPPFDSPVVRRALNLAVDREALIRRVLLDRGAPATGPLWPRYWAYDTSVVSDRFDPALAVSLLEGAGFRLGRAPGTADTSRARLRFTCLIPAGFSIWERMALEVQKHLYNIGVDVQFEVVPFQQFDTLFREGRFEAALIDLISGPTPARAYIFWQSSRRYKGLNVFGYENAEAERLFDVLRTTTNEGAVRSATRRLQSVFLDDPPALFLAWNERTRAVRRDFQVVQEPDRDPLLTLWRWTPAAGRSAVSTQ